MLVLPKLNPNFSADDGYCGSMHESGYLCHTPPILSRDASGSHVLP